MSSQWKLDFDLCGCKNVKIFPYLKGRPRPTIKNSICFSESEGEIKGCFKTKLIPYVSVLVSLDF